MASAITFIEPSLSTSPTAPASETWASVFSPMGHAVTQATAPSARLG